MSKSHSDFLVSVIIPTHNRKDLLIRAVNSVLSQTYKKLEVIIVDDNSSDDTESFVTSQLGSLIESGQVRFFASKESLGNAKARNVGIKEAQGDFVAFLDDDDVWLSGKLSRQISELERTNTDGCFCGTQWVEGSTVLKSTVARNPEVSFENGGPTSTWLLRKDVFNRIGYFDESFPANVDGEFLVRFNKNCTSSFVDEALYIHYYYENQITASSSRKVAGFKKMIAKHGGTFNGKEFASAYLKLSVFELFLGIKDYGAVLNSLRHRTSLQALFLATMFILPKPLTIYVVNKVLDLMNYPQSYAGRYGHS